MNYTQEELSEMIDISTRSLQRIENGENDLKQLQFHSIGMIYEKALFILEKYFDT